jgi:hypothetical protein
MTHGQNKKNFEIKTFEEFIATITQHIPDKHFQMVRYGACPELVEGDGIPIGAGKKETRPTSLGQKISLRRSLRVGVKLGTVSLLPDRKSNDKHRTLPRMTSSCNTPAMPLDYFLADGEAHARSFIIAASAMKPLEGGENLVKVLFFKTNPVVFYDDFTPCTIRRSAGNPYDGFLSTLVELEGIAYHMRQLRQNPGGPGC